MTRRGLFAAVFGGGGAATAAPAPVRYLDPLCTVEWKIEKYACNPPCDCECCDRADFDARWRVWDRCTNVVRYMCDACVKEFREQPVRLFSHRAAPWPLRALPADWFIPGGWTS